MPMRIIKVSNMITEIKHMVDKFNRKLDTTRERIRELEDWWKYLDWSIQREKEEQKFT